MPKFVLANKLYRGTLLNEFCDITWLEEMVCAIFRTKAHVTHLSESIDPKQPFIYSGNSCVHEVNVVSTASVLPRTLGDVNSMCLFWLRQFNHRHMGSMMRIHKNTSLAIFNLVEKQ